jgi:hypothetical protein
MPDPSDPNAPAPKKPRLTKTMASYQALVDAFRKAPGNYSVAAALAGCHRSAAKIAWLRGWDKLGLLGAGPIRDVIDADLAKARQLAAEAARKERDLADAELARRRAEAVKALEDEALLMTSNRRSLLSLSGTVEKMIGILPLYALQIQEAVAIPDPQNPGKLIPKPNPAVSVELALAVVAGVGLSAQRVAYATSRLLELSKKDRDLTAVVSEEADLSEPIEVIEEIRSAATLFDRLEAAAKEAADAAAPHPTVQ